MDRHVETYYKRSSDDDMGGKFHEVIALHDSPDISWESIHKRVPSLPRGWYELSQLPIRDRIEFCRDYWLSQFPYHPNLSDFLVRFFDSLDDLGIYITQQKWEDPYHVEMIYSLSGDSGYYTGKLPSAETDLLNLQKEFPQYILPKDYLAFLQIHDGFCKTTDCTGVIPWKKMKDEYDLFQLMLLDEPNLSTSKGAPVDPKSLIPFYKSFGVPFYQCFWGEWYPQQEMGNVYYSHTSKTISDVSCSDTSCESMAFPTFIDWLMFYLERVE